MQDGRIIRMDELQIGDRVQTMMQDGSIDFQEMYFMAHANAKQQAAFITIRPCKRPRSLS